MKGRKGQPQLDRIRTLEEYAEKLLEENKAVARIADELTQARSNSAPDVSGLEFQRKYSPKHGRPRAYVSASAGTQAQPLWVQELLHPDSEVWKLGCAMPRILALIVTRLHVQIV